MQEKETAEGTASSKMRSTVSAKNKKANGTEQIEDMMRSDEATTNSSSLGAVTVKIHKQ